MSQRTAPRKSKAIYYQRKWFIGAYTLVVTRLRGEDYLILGKDRSTVDTYDLFGGRSDTEHENDLRKTASLELMEETAGLMRAHPKWFLNQDSIDFPIETHQPGNLPSQTPTYGKCYCLHLSQLNQEEFNFNYRLLSKRKVKRYWLEKHRIDFFRISDLIEALNQQMIQKGQIQDGIRIRPYDPYLKRYQRNSDIINRRTTKLIAAHLQDGILDHIINKKAIDLDSQTMIDLTPGFLKGTYFYQF